MATKFSKATITIRDDQKVWLKDHPGINFSGMIQRWLDNYMRAYEGRNDAEMLIDALRENLLNANTNNTFKTK
jgi:hypothetical protein